MASDNSVVVTATDEDGEPLTGLSPTWHAFFNTDTDGAVAGPAISPIGNGQYKLIRPSSYDAGGLVDLGATAEPRYMLVQPARSFLFVGYDDAGTPKAGLFPTWISILALPSATPVSPQPPITILGSGVYKVLTAQLVDQHLAGVLRIDPVGDLVDPVVAGFDSRYEDGSSGDIAAPAFANVNPVAGAEIDPADAVSFEVTDNLGLFSVVVISVLFASSGTEEMVYDGSSFVGPYVELSERTLITDGFAFSIKRTGEWPTPPTLKVTAVDASGNKAVL